MSNFTEVLKTDAVQAFTSVDEFAETAVYTKAVTGATRTINAVIVRQSPTTINGVPSPSAVVRVVNDTTYGIAMSEFNGGGDTLTIALRSGGTARAYQLKLPSDGSESEDPGLCLFEIHN